VCIYIYIYVCVCVCVFMYIRVWLYVCVYVYVYVYVCAFVCEDMHAQMHTPITIHLWDDSVLPNGRNFNLTDSWTYFLDGASDPQTTITTHCQIFMSCSRGPDIR